MDAVKNWMKNEHNYDVERRWIVNTPGVVFAIACAIKAFTQEGEAVIIQTPVYYPFKNMIELNNRTLVTSSLFEKDGKWQIDFEDFEKKIAENNVKKREFVMQAEENRWMFGEDETDYLGIGTRRALDVDAKIPQNRKEKRAFETTAKKNTWHFGRDETEYQGAVGVRSYESEEKKVPKNLVEKSKLADRAAGQTWHFGASADDYKGSGPTHAQNGQIDIPQNRVEKSQLEAEAEARTYHISDGPKGEQDLATLAQQAESNTWHFGKSPEEYEGNGTMHADRMDGEPTKKDNEELIQPWPAQSYAMQMPGSKEDLLMT